jgi:hypothetical protein
VHTTWAAFACGGGSSLRLKYDSVVLRGLKRGKDPCHDPEAVLVVLLSWAGHILTHRLPFGSGEPDHHKPTTDNDKGKSFFRLSVHLFGTTGRFLEPTSLLY